MTTIERSIQVNASAEDVVAYTVDSPHNYPEWYAGVESIEVDDLYPEEGGQLRLHYKAAGASFEITLTVLEHVRGEYLVQQMEGMINGTQTWSYTADGGGTTINAVFEYQMPGGGLGAIADKLVVERMNTQNLEKSLENLKVMLEG